ncbi:RSP_2648 family PIN domain-containing protein [Palleronia caenipelagi]|uniref:PIN domain-containing protein n=1 Tax=Palleronia caenipelagi TaxID=2489174 RepID=A0A547PXK8_9RHOB|nr:PIN domain-containing protein [Palleronia caenipelagi]TRD18887.1 PIN domain-containing protein [Palleronia caenipelagi]
MKVFLDACVLYPTVLREILMGVAGAGAFQPQFSPRVLEEWAGAAARLGPEGEAVARGEIALLRSQWPGAEVQPRERDLARLWLPDANDVHVLAGAIVGGADVLCTFNAKDFPRRTLTEEGIERLDPDQLLGRLMPGHRPAIAEVVARVHATAERLSGEEIPLRGLLKRARLPKLGKSLRPQD